MRFSQKILLLLALLAIAYGQQGAHERALEENQTTTDLDKAKAEEEAAKEKEEEDDSPTLDASDADTVGRAAKDKIFHCVNVTDGANIPLEKCEEITASATDLSALWHPYVVLYFGHVIVHVIMAFLSIKASIVAFGLMLASGLVFFISAVGDINLWGQPDQAPGDLLWWGVFTKWLLVNLFATAPVTAIRAFQLTEFHTTACGVFVYVILGGNIVWTFFNDGEGLIIRYVNRAAGAGLLISLIIRIFALYKNQTKLVVVAKLARGERYTEDLVSSGNRFPYGLATSLPWLVCYTIWNVFFCIDISTGMTLQDIGFWIIMYVYWYLDSPRQPIEFYFMYARPISLGSYIMWSEWAGTFIPFFRDSKTLDEHAPLETFRHAYFMFICCMNVLFSIVVICWSVQEALTGFGKPNHKIIKELLEADMGDKREMYDMESDYMEDSDAD
eukprot:gnl/TRDRNA2_/TRDRNA2_189333_c0_seq1.p1 gnl/TRDRNA2_/TRDRNA2_189333_c0~~gnl/TRDRNA2_/TRDRNA2_189333_c0_seq1.p1  ORF type:complete len:444 (-),score=100.35 gnl/TRDRNA2_/TRDRNA2_189333_c0_seq1:157-1488(-)